MAKYSRKSVKRESRNRDWLLIYQLGGTYQVEAFETWIECRTRVFELMHHLRWFSIESRRYQYYYEWDRNDDFVLAIPRDIYS